MPSAQAARQAATATIPVSANELQFIARLRAGGETAFMELVDKYHAALIRLALMFVPTRVIAEDKVQGRGSACGKAFIT